MKVIRQSGMPVQLQNLESYKSEWTLEFDKLQAKHGLNMLDLSKDAAVLETELLKKYGTIEIWEPLKTAKAWRSKVLEYGPILVATQQGSKELVYVIADQLNL